MRFSMRAAALALALSATAMWPTAASAAVDEQALVVSQAETQIGKPFRLGTEGPTQFDCSGLVYYVFSQAGLLDRIGGQRFLADEYYRWGRERGLLSKTGPRVGDLVLWKYATSKRIKHIGIYVGENAKGKPLAISALTVGVMQHRVDRITVPFFSYVHTGLDFRPDPPPPPPDPTPSPIPDPTPPPQTPPPPTPDPAPLATP